MRPAPARLTLAIPAAALTLTLLGAAGCIEHRVKTEPIQINVDVNLRVDERLREFFEYEQRVERRVLEQEGPPPTGVDPATDPVSRPQHIRIK